MGIPLVRATEAGKAHTGNLRSRGRRIVIWRTVARAGRGGAEVSTSGPPKRVRAPSVVSSLVRLGPKESCTLILVHKAGDKLLQQQVVHQQRVADAHKYAQEVQARDVSLAAANT